MTSLEAPPILALVFSLRVGRAPSPWNVDQNGNRIQAAASMPWYSSSVGTAKVEALEHESVDQTLGISAQ